MDTCKMYEDVFRYFRGCCKSDMKCVMSKTLSYGRRTPVYGEVLYCILGVSHGTLVFCEELLDFLGDYDELLDFLGDYDEYLSRTSKDI